MNQTPNALRFAALAFSIGASLQTTPSSAQELAEPPPGPEPAAGYDKGFYVRSDDDAFELKIQARVQARYTLEILEHGPDESHFAIQRARLTLAGHAFTPTLTYKFQSDFGRGFVTLKDFYANYQFTEGLELRAGQWKRPFSRQQINSSGNLQLVDRALTDRNFGAGRDIGIVVHNDYESSPEFEYAFGVFNGTGEAPIFSGDVTGDVLVDPATGEGEIIDGQVTGGSFSNVPDRFWPALVARVGYNSAEMKGYSEADLERGPLRVAVGASGMAGFDFDDDNQSVLLGEIDYALKVEGFSTTGGVYIASAQDGGSFSDRAFQRVGVHIQAGYLVAELLEPALRYGWIGNDGDDNDQQEILAAISLYFFKHGFKWQTDGGLLLSEECVEGDCRDYRIRTQLQLAF
jgi:hypothetical protein